MIGLEFILETFNTNANQLANDLGISRYTVYDWLKERRDIPKKRIDQLSQHFNVPWDFFQKELSEIEKLEIQKNKLARDSKPVILGYQQALSLEEMDIVEEPIFDNSEMNKIILDIEKAKIYKEFSDFLRGIENDDYILLLQQLMMMLHKNISEPIFQNTIDVLSHYYDVLPDWVGNWGYSGLEFEEELISLFKKNEKPLRDEMETWKEVKK